MATSKQTTGAYLRRLRTDRGWTVDDLYERLCDRYGPQRVPAPRTIWRAEDGERMSLRHEFVLAQMFDMVPSDIWPPRPKRRPRHAVAA